MIRHELEEQGVTYVPYVRNKQQPTDAIFIDNHRCASFIPLTERTREWFRKMDHVYRWGEDIVVAGRDDIVNVFPFHTYDVMSAMLNAGLTVRFLNENGRYR